MGGSGAPDDMDQAHMTQAWLAAGDDTRANVTGQYFYHLKRMEPNLQSHDTSADGLVKNFQPGLRQLDPAASASRAGFS